MCNYKNGNILFEMTPREAAIYNLMLGGYTLTDATELLNYVYLESVKRINTLKLKNSNY